MAGTSGIGSGARVVAGGALAVVVAIAAYFGYQKYSTGIDALVPVVAGQSEPVVVVAPVMPAEAQPAVPSFDVVRVEPDGSSVIAGTTNPGDDVTILLNGTEVGHATADARGKFVAVLSVPGSENAQVLSLSTQNSGGAVVVSDDSVILTPAPKPEPADMAGAAETANTPTDPAAPAPLDQSAPLAIVSAQAPSMAPPPPQAPAVLLANDEGVRVLQPAETGPSAMRNVVIDAISYDAEGEVQLSGRGTGTGAGFVRVYLDNTPIQTTPIKKGGAWHLQLPDVDTGIYTLRVDQVDAAGTVTSRAETPFKREAAAVLQNAQNASPAQQIKAITVQPGSTLWAIAHDRYGDGALYIRVFEANRDNIRNPDLIYPGQVFAVPE